MRLFLASFLLLALLVACGGSPQAAIDLGHWKLTLPTDEDGDGVADELDPDALIEKLARDELRPYLYWEASGALHFFVEPAGGTTPNSDYPRTELREQIVPGDDDENWSLDGGGTLSARLQVLEVSRNEDGDTYKLAVAQIHGKDGPPLLKLVWQNGRLEARIKKLRAATADPEDPDSWVDARPLSFGEPVSHEPFTLRIEAGREEVSIQVNDEVQTFVHEDLQKWPFENYFKAGTYLFSTDEKAHASARFFELRAEHP